MTNRTPQRFTSDYASELVEGMKADGKLTAYRYQCFDHRCRGWHVDVDDGTEKHVNRHFCS